MVSEPLNTGEKYLEQAIGGIVEVLKGTGTYITLKLRFRLESFLSNWNLEPNYGRFQWFHQSSKTFIFQSFCCGSNWNQNVVVPTVFAVVPCCKNV